MIIYSVDKPRAPLEGQALVREENRAAENQTRKASLLISSFTNASFLALKAYKV